MAAFISVPEVWSQFCSSIKSCHSKSKSEWWYVNEYIQSYVERRWSYMKRLSTLLFSFFCLALLLAIPFQGECATPAAKFPYVSFDRVAIGGIQPLTSTRDYVRSIYGEPDKITKRPETGKFSDSEITETWNYGDSFSISFSNDWVFCLSVDGLNGLATPDGIKVGDSESKLISTYGRKWKLGYWYKSDNDCNLTIGVKNGKITRIFAGWNL